jgi:hypothetical protein
MHPDLYNNKVAITTGLLIQAMIRNRIQGYGDAFIFLGVGKQTANFHVPNCVDTCAALDEVVFSKKFGQSLITVITLGIVSPVEVKWKCHKPCQRINEGL